MIRRIVREEIPKVAEMLARVFNDYKEMQVLYGGVESRRIVLTKFFEDQMNHIYKTGDIFVSDDLKAAYYGYDSANTWYLKIIVCSGINMMKMIMRLSKEERKKISENGRDAAGTENPFWYRKFVKGRYYYLLILGVDEELRGKGMVRQLLGKLVEECNEKKISLILDTHSERNVSIYEHYGFKVVKTYESKTGKLKRFCMVKQPN